MMGHTDFFFWEMLNLGFVIGECVWRILVKMMWLIEYACLQDLYKVMQSYLFLVIHAPVSIFCTRIMNFWCLVLTPN